MNNIYIPETSAAILIHNLVVKRTLFAMPTPNDPLSLSNIDNIHQFEALFNFATIGIVVTDNEGKIINFNRYAETQFGYSRAEAVGELVDILLPDSMHMRHAQYRNKYYELPEPRIMGHGRDLFAKNKDGTTFPVEVSLSHYVIKEKLFVIAFVIDITVRKEQESQAVAQNQELERVTTAIRTLNLELEQKVEDRTKMLREALVELELSKEELKLAFENEKELGELKSRFATMASHEFRTPLSTILSSAFLLEQYNSVNADPKIEKHILRIKGAVSGMKNILEEFLSLGKLEEGLVQAKMETVDPSTAENIVKELLQELDGLITGQQINFAGHLEKPFWIDKSLLKNILSNIISNAIKFTAENGIIDITVLQEEGMLVLHVKDNGIGISEEDQPHLFQRFFRARNALNIQGTGLGLHIVGKYLELMNGTISLKSRLNEGTVITLSIPQNR